MSSDQAATTRTLHVTGGLSRIPWLFDPITDLSMFLGSALMAMGLLLIGMLSQTIEDQTPEWLWVVAILLIDVAHVYSTAFRVYLDREELQRRPWLYGLTPLLAFVIGAAVYSEDSLLFWRLLAYLAVFHFVRQQYGWVALYRARAGEQDRLGWWIDAAAIYLATLYPLAWWHASLPRNFHWFMDGDFVNLPHLLVSILQPLYWLSLAVYTMRALCRLVWYNAWNPGKDIVVLTTTVCWHVGIISMNSDYAFTVTNVIIHGVPYLVLVYRMQSRQTDEQVAEPPESGLQTTLPPPCRTLRRRLTVWQFLGLCWILAYLEELLWDNGVWQERPWLFGTLFSSPDAESWLPPLLAVPQITHYVLDGFIWKRRQHTDLGTLTSSEAVGLSESAASTGVH
ncbi:MAG: hypothetical protein ACK58L_19855 [Planctomycetota bacterium]